MSAAFEVLNPGGKGRVVLICEHASPRIPSEYNGLGLVDGDRHSHAAWDPGALALARLLSDPLDAPVVASTVSRMVYDCNRPPEAASAVPQKSELISIPGNVGLTPDQMSLRVKPVYEPFCQAVSQVLDARARDTVVVTVHSFTPVFFGQYREVELGLLHDSDTRLADAMLARTKMLSHRKIKRNEPYGPADGVTHSLRLHAQSRGLANVMIEVRNDLLSTDDQIAAMAEEILVLLRPALKDIAIKEEQS